MLQPTFNQEIIEKIFIAILNGDLETVRNLLTKYPDLHTYKTIKGYSFYDIALNSMKENIRTEDRKEITYLLDNVGIPGIDPNSSFNILGDSDSDSDFE